MAKVPAHVRVYLFLNKTPIVTIKILESAFPKVKKSTLSKWKSYHKNGKDYQGRLIKKGKTKSKKSTKKKTTSKTTTKTTPSLKLTLFSPQLKMQELAEDGDIRAVTYMLENEHRFNIGKSNPPYERPKTMSPRQNEIIDAMTDNTTQIVMVEGDKRTGKSTSAWVAINESVWNGTRKFWGMWGKTEKSMSKIHRDVRKDEITKFETFPLQLGHSMMKTSFFNGGYAEVHSTTIDDTSGLAYQGVWVDEFHNVIKEKPEVWTMILMILRSEPHLKILLTCNMGTGAYQLLKAKLREEKYKGRVAFFTLLKKHTTHITDEADELITDMVEIIDEGTANRMLRNEYDYSGDTFNFDSLEDAYKMYKLFMLQEPLPKNIVLGIDPSGTRHKWGWFLGAYNDGTYWEIDSGEIQMGMPDGKGDVWSPQRLESFFVTLCLSIPGIDVVIESNTGGARLKTVLQMKGIKCRKQNFSGSETGKSREDFIYVAERILSDRAMVLNNRKLFNQQVNYNPTKSLAEKFKGNVADAWLHFCWRVAYLAKSKHRLKFISK